MTGRAGRTQKEGTRVLNRTVALANARERYIVDADYNILEDETFKNNIRIRDVELPNVEVIGREAFYSCSALWRGTFPRVLVIREGAFANCSNLKRAEYPDTLRELEREAFYKCKRMKSIDFGENKLIKKIPEKAFAECRQLEELKLPVNLQEIGTMAFYKCDGLVQVKLPDTLKIIGGKAFYQCGFKSLELPEGLEEIGESAFLKCKSLEYVKIPSSVKQIGKWAFHGCSRLKVLEIMHEPEKIGEWLTNKNCTIRCPKGSRMEAYAAEYGMQTEEVDNK